VTSNLYDITSVEYRGGHRLYLRFEDGLEGELDLTAFLHFDGVFEGLKDPKEFAKVSLYPEGDTIVWQNGADIAPETLREELERKAGQSRR
jgi:hypothetical protein